MIGGRRFRNAWPIAAWLLAASAGGCSHAHPMRPVVQEHLPPQVIEVEPPSRAVRVPCDAIMRARFREPLDSTTVNSLTVFLKIDTRRIPMTVTLTDSGRTIVLRPRATLEAHQIFTVELTPRIRTVAGVEFGATYFWQFTTVSVRPIADPDPPDGSDFQSPVAPLFWQETEPAAGQIRYDIYLGSDSSQVAAALEPTITTSEAHLLQTANWPQDRTVFWRVRVTNLDTGDSSLGPTWRFRAAPASAESFTILLPVFDCATWDGTGWTCNQLRTSLTQTGIARFDLASLDSTLVVADAVMAIDSFDNPNSRAPYLMAAGEEWIPCSPRFRGLPLIIGLLAPCVGSVDSRIQFTSALLGSQLQARIRRHSGLFDYVFVSGAGQAIQYFPFLPGSGVELHCLRRKPGPQSGS